MFYIPSVPIASIILSRLHLRLMILLHAEALPFDLRDSLVHVIKLQKQLHMIGSIHFPELNETYYRALNPDLLVFIIPITSTTHIQERLDTEFELSNDKEATAREANGDRESAEQWNVRTLCFEMTQASI